ncbi:mismatch repair protein MLH3 NDAI_0K01290 [Naumovozyma dairenensis CBS 421]|uniref:MutL C-terminal dimerisation domain-containing protein n=1 Tax=Naumovozyma dairenensis (strain ATCC 10597 / BCRC 20456 / CBS 421 / NBRC 0211 / NRRL Y-12639) TaxID=1071378 RepID=G0WHQ9_NAUDC|nr:hypothetical protein NDAI_0K01290 [Naumovozyma dairenensis CBS 421]CCD27320.1 hypothetical protein NDAI_0K01290 [Naumovozyma dairenensis CBS 421]
MQMTQRIHGLPKSVSHRLRSQTSAISIPSILTELVQNSIDANATKITVTLDISNYNITIIDNGIGMIPKELDLLGNQNHTSKITTLNDIENVKTFGFRGEAIFAISELSKLTIYSKSHEYNSVWGRTFPQSSRMLDSHSIREYEHQNRIFYSELECMKSGTVVIVEDMFYNLVVRKEIFKKEPTFKIFNKIKKDMFQLLIAHPELELKIQKIEANGQASPLIFSHLVSEDLSTFQMYSYVFRNIFGPVVPINMMKKVALKFRNYNMQGVISKYPVKTKDYQFIFFNKRRYTNETLFKQINSIFKESNFGYGGVINSTVKSVGKPYTFYPLLIININGPPLSINDLLQAPSKEIYEPSDGHIIRPLLLRLVKSFLQAQGYTPSTNQAITCSRESSMNKIVKTELSDENGNLPSKTVMSHILDSKMKSAKFISSEMEGRTDLKLSLENKNIASNLHVPNMTLLPPFKRRHDLSSRKSSTTSAPKKCKLHSPEKHDCWLDIPNTFQPITPESDTYQTPNKKHGIHSNNSNNETTVLNKTVLKNCQVINQIDNKFILLRVNDNINGWMLSIMDQHACDERIKLETYLNSFLIDILHGTLTLQYISDLQLNVSLIEISLFKFYVEEFRKWGINYEIILDKTDHTANSILKVISLPKLLETKINGDKNYLKSVLLQHCYDLKDLKKLRLNTMKMTFDIRTQLDNFQWWKYLNSIPTVFIEFFNSKSCRSAIKFGDKLTKEECELLIRQLSNCKVPFQCAHGRPSIVPITNLVCETNTNYLTKRNNYSLKGTSLDYDI